MNKKKLINIIIYLIIIPLLIGLGIVLFNDRNYMLISYIIMIISIIPFFIRFEKHNNSVREIVAIAAMIALTVLGRAIFAPIQNFKPVTALIIITGIAFGGEAGFIVGSLSALTSNIFFGQGPWTPFQMFAFGIIGFISGILFYKKNNKQNPKLIFVLILGFLGGILYSLLLDIWTTLSLDGVFTIKRYLANIVTAIPVTAIYCASNIIFLLILTKPLLNELNRIKLKYNIFN